MKKFFAFAIALVTCALTFTSCEKKIESPLVGSWNTRGGAYIVDISTGQTQYFENAERWFHFHDNGQFQYFLYTSTFNGYTKEGTWSVDGDILTLHWTKYGVVTNNNTVYNSKFIPEDETVKWRIDGHYVYFTRNYGTDKEETVSFYDGSY